MNKFALVAIVLLLTSAAAEARHYRGHYVYGGSAGTAAAAHFQDQFKNSS